MNMRRFWEYFRRSTKAKVISAIIVFMFFIPFFVHSIFYIYLINIALVFSIVACSLRLVSLSGQISMGHGGMMSIGAYGSAVLAKIFVISPWVTMPIGGLLTFLIAYLVGIPFARLRGLYFSMITLFFGLAILSVNQLFTKYTGGYTGLNLIPPLFTGSRVPYYYFFLLLFLVCLAIMYRLEFSRIGVTWKAIAQSYAVAASTGINESRQRVLNFAIGSCFAGIAGAAYAHYSLVISQSNFSFLSSINLIIYMVVGGIGSFVGPIIGTAILATIPNLFLTLKLYAPFVSVGILLFVLLFARQGLVGLPSQIWNLVKRLKK